MLEANALPPELILDDPIQATVAWSHDPSLTRPAELANGKSVTCVDHQRLWFAAAEKFLEGGAYDELIPNLDEVMELWGKTLDRLETAAETGDFDSLTGDLDWVLKQRCLQMAIDSHQGLDWQAPAIKQLDHCYSNLDLADGLYWAYERSGVVNRIVEEKEIQHFQCAPPEDTRAWSRAQLLRRTRDNIDLVDWDRIRYRIPGQFERPILRMTDPFGLGREATEDFFEEPKSIDEIVYGTEFGT